MSDRGPYAAKHLREVEDAAHRVRTANADFFATLKKAVGKKAYRRIEEHEQGINGHTFGAIDALSEQFGLKNDLGQTAARGDGGVFEQWEAIGTFRDDRDREIRPPPAWAKDYPRGTA